MKRYISYLLYILFYALTLTYSGCASDHTNTDDNDYIHKIANMSTDEDDVLDLIKRLRHNKPTMNEASTWAYIANSKEYTDVRRRRAVLQLLDRYVLPGMNLSELADLLKAPTWLKRRNIHHVQMVFGRIALESVKGETIYVIMIGLPDNDSSGFYIRVEGTPTQEELYNNLQGKATDVRNLKISALAIRPKVAEERSLVTNTRDNPQKHKPSRHWQIMFSKSNLDIYAQELDFFGVELAVLTPNGKIIYAHDFSKLHVKTHTTNDPTSEKRYYLAPQTGEPMEPDLKLLQRAGIDVGDRLILKFIPLPMESQLVNLEKSYRNSHDKKDTTMIRFGIRKTEHGFSFYVLDQLNEGSEKGTGRKGPAKGSGKAPRAEKGAEKGTPITAVESRPGFLDFSGS